MEGFSATLFKESFAEFILTPLPEPRPLGDTTCLDSCETPRSTARNVEPSPTNSRALSKTSPLTKADDLLAKKEIQRLKDRVAALSAASGVVGVSPRATGLASSPLLVLRPPLQSPPNASPVSAAPHYSIATLLVHVVVPPFGLSPRSHHGLAGPAPSGTAPAPFAAAPRLGLATLSQHVHAAVPPSGLFDGLSHTFSKSKNISRPLRGSSGACRYERSSSNRKVPCRKMERGALHALRRLVEDHYLPREKVRNMTAVIENIRQAFGERLHHALSGMKDDSLRNSIMLDEDLQHSGSALFRQFVQELNAVYAQTDDVFKPNIEDPLCAEPSVFKTARRKEGITEYFETKSELLMPFEYALTCQYLSRLVMLEHRQEDRWYCAAAQDIENTVGICFRLLVMRRADRNTSLQFRRNALSRNGVVDSSSLYNAFVHNCGVPVRCSYMYARARNGYPTFDSLHQQWVLSSGKRASFRTWEHVPCLGRPARQTPPVQTGDEYVSFSCELTPANAPQLHGVALGRGPAVLILIQVLVDPVVDVSLEELGHWRPASATDYGLRIVERFTIKATTNSENLYTAYEIHHEWRELSCRTEVTIEL
ncbi:hypothetical protein ON010_g14283 [Phytophthora cinnamomi]|nr:hypothetical protein ON010_g14283 [Phytophthora cinnamomi]